jgi:hypothetical protein
LVGVDVRVGSNGTGLGRQQAMSRKSFRFLIGDMDEGTESNIASMLPANKSAGAGADPNLSACVPNRDVRFTSGN